MHSQVAGQNELNTLYDGFLVFEPESEYTPPKDLSDSFGVLPLYHNAIVDNIVFLMGVSETYKGEFIRKSRIAFNTYWRENAKGKRVKRMRW